MRLHAAKQDSKLGGLAGVKLEYKQQTGDMFKKTPPPSKNAPFLFQRYRP